MNEFEIFRHKYDELRLLCETPEPYNLLKASGILRNLLFDNPSLVDQVNRHLKEKLKFSVVPSDFFIFDMPELKPSFQYNSIFPGDLPKIQPSLLSRDQFFALPILGYEGKKYSVRLLVKFVANVLGGVHYDPASEKEADYAKLMQLKRDVEGKMTFLHQETGIYLPPDVLLIPLSSIGNVVLETLAPIRKKL